MENSCICLSDLAILTPLLPELKAQLHACVHATTVILSYLYIITVYKSVLRIFFATKNVSGPDRFILS